MRQVLVSIFDRKVGVFGAPHAFVNAEAAYRAVKAAARPGWLVSDFSEDYMVYRMGLFDEGSGELISEDPRPVFLCSVESLLGGHTRAAVVSSKETEVSGDAR